MSDWRTLVQLAALCVGLMVAPAAAEPSKAVTPASKPSGEGLKSTRDNKSVAAAIDKEIDARLVVEKVKPAARADDAEFLRRAYLDIAGRIPTAQEAATFLDEKSADKRAKLIDTLLASPDYGRNLANVWRHLLVPVDTPVQIFVSSPALGKLLAERFNTNYGWDEIVRRLFRTKKDDPSLTAFDKGPFETLDAGNVMNSVLKTGRGPAPAGPTTAYKARLFLGVKLLCAECHNDKYKPWTQDDYWGLVAAANGTTTFKIPDNGESKRVGEAIPAKLLDGKPLPDETKPGQAAFLDWMTAPDNPYFAKNMANRMWFHFFNRGLIHPVGDLHANAKPSHPELLDLLAKEFVASKFDVKHLVRCICNSEAYQRTSRWQGEEPDPALFARMAVKPMTADQLYDSLAAATGLPEVSLEPLTARFNQTLTEGGPPKVVPRDRFVNVFVNCKTQDDDPNDYRRGVPQMLAVMNTTGLNKVGPTAKAAADLPREKAIEALFLGTLSRRPTAAEAKHVAEYLASRGEADPATNYASLLWVLLVGSEFNVVR